MKNNQPVPKTAFEKPPISDLLEENQIIQWISENGRVLLIGFLFAIALFFTAYRFSSFGIVKSELNYINAENEYQRFMAEKNRVQSEETLKRLMGFMTTDPQLYAKYDGQIAEKLLVEGEVAKGLPFAKRALERTESESGSNFTNYSKNSLLIAEQKYEEALKKSLNLNDTMIKEGAENSLLFAFNLLRIGALQQELGLKKEEASTWEEWNKRAALNRQEELNILISRFNADKLSLTDYIESRKKFLNSSL